MSTAGEKILGYKKVIQGSLDQSQYFEVYQWKETLHQCRHNIIPNTRGLYQEYVDKDKKVKRSAQKNQRIWLANMVEKAEIAAIRTDMRIVYQIAKNIAGSSKVLSGLIKAKEKTSL